MATYVLLAVVLLPILLSPLFILLRKREGAMLPLLVGCSLLGFVGTLIPLLFLLLGKEVPAVSIPFAVGQLCFEADAFRALYGALCGLLFAAAALFSPSYFHTTRHLSRYGFFYLLTFGGTLGVFFAADLLTLFIFFELLSLCSVFFVVHEETPAALSAAKTYLAVSILGGLLLFLGITYLYSITDTLEISRLAKALRGTMGSLKLWMAGICLILGFGAKAGLFPLHIWLPKAHPAAPAPASALLSGMLTKVGVFGVIVTALRIFGGDEAMAWLLMTLAAITMLLGAVLGVFSVDLKRTLACSSMSQIGFILCGVAACIIAPSSAAGSGVVLHMVNHTLIKLLLFLVAGAIYENAHTLDLNRLRGWGRGKPFLAVCFLLGGLDLAGIPGFGGYISKSMLHEAVVEAAHHLGGISFLYEWVFLFSGGLTLAYMLKLFLCIFVERPSEVSSDLVHSGKPSVVQTAVLGVSGLLLLPLGVPSVSLRLGLFGGEFLLGEKLPFEADLFGWECLSGILISVFVGLAVYFLFVRGLLCRKGVYRDLWPKALDLEEKLYRPCMAIAVFLFRVVCRIPDLFMDSVIYLLRKTVLHDRGVEGKPHVGSVTTDFIGQVEDKLTGKTGHVEHLAAWRKHEIDGAKRLIGSFYFAMAATCVGIVVFIIYVLIEQFGV